MYDGTYHDYDFDSSQTAVDSAGGMGMTEVMLIIGIILIAALLALTIIMMIKVVKMRASLDNICIKLGNMETNNNSKGIGVVFCKKCGCSYSSTESKCPFCGTKK